MAFKDISILFNNSINNIPSFLSDCKIYEKMNTHYVKISILNQNNIVCLKGNNEVVTQADIILNGMWRNYIEDWTLIKNNPGFKEFAKRYTGCTLGIYYFPNHNPLGTEYNFKTDRCYIINQIYDNYSKTEISVSFAFSELKTFAGVSGLNNVDGKYCIMQTHELKISNNDIYDFCEQLKNNQFDDNCKAIYDIINKDNIIATDKSKVNLIFKHKKVAYQLTNKDASDSKYITDPRERSSYEFVLCDFVKFFHQFDMMNKVRGSYRNIVCYLFNEYITKNEMNTHYLENNINPESIEPPHVGYNHGDSINSIYVPNTLTRNLCNSSVLYKNVFKLLLANLKVYKNKKYCVYMNDEQIGALNTIVHAIEIIKTDQDQYKKKAQKHIYKK